MKVNRFVVITFFSIVALPIWASETPPMTVDCDISYLTWNSLNEPANTSEQIPVHSALSHVQSTGVNRNYVRVIRTTADHRFEVVVDAVEPLNGDILKLKVIQIHVNDLVSKLSVEPSYPSILAPQKDVLTATQLITWNLDANHPEQPGSQLNAVCNLR